MDAVLADWKTADIPEKTRAALRLLECITLRPAELDVDFVQGLRADGLDDAAMREVANVSFHFNMMNRFADAFDFPLLTAEQEAIQTKMLNRAGKFLKGTQANPIWTRDSDGDIRPTELARARQPLLTAPGKTSVALRQAVESYIVQQRGGQARPNMEKVPRALLRYAKKLASYAYKITDEDVDALREVGYQDEAIYEITAAGAFGAALVGVEQLFGVLYGQTESEVVQA